ncbi:hypothetical protein AB0H83_09505 [Dactylosporangium sp. NPDC050688]|uniref:hypothetical protein n=1 Tax=Dactylosporangium sp. NPDC050688 TaxID=3157217 RepID=UPI003409CF2E
MTSGPPAQRDFRRLRLAGHLADGFDRRRLLVAITAVQAVRRCRCCSCATAVTCLSCTW